MSKIVFPLTLIVAVLICLLRAAPAQAQAIRTFVSAAGSDSNPCSITQPCRHFQAAVTATALGGEVDALDPGAYGSFTISQAITIEGQGWSYAAPPNFAAAITINAGSDDRVKIRGVSLNGVNTNHSVGIAFNSGRGLEIFNCAISDFGDGGISVTSATAMSVLISNTTVTSAAGSGHGAISLVANASGATITATLNDVTVSNNYEGVYAAAVAATLELMISNSHIDNNSYGVYLSGFNTGNPPNITIMKNVTLNQDMVGVNTSGTLSVYLSQVTQAAAPGVTSIGVQLNGGGTFSYSDGTNHLMGGVAGGGFSPWSFQ
jgi:hypothetical protein